MAMLVYRLPPAPTPLDLEVQRIAGSDKALSQLTTRLALTRCIDAADLLAVATAAPAADLPALLRSSEAHLALHRAVSRAARTSSYGHAVPVPPDGYVDVHEVLGEPTPPPAATPASAPAPTSSSAAPAAAKSTAPATAAAAEPSGEALAAARAAAVAAAKEQWRDAMRGRAEERAYTTLVADVHGRESAQAAGEAVATFGQQASLGANVGISLVTAAVVGYFLGSHFVDVNNKAGVRSTAPRSLPQSMRYLVPLARRPLRSRGLWRPPSVRRCCWWRSGC